MPQSDFEILFVSHKHPPAIGGMEKQSYELVNGAALYARVHTLVYTEKENILTFFFLLNKRILKKLDENPGIRVIHFNDGLLASIALFHRGYNPIKKTVTLHGLDVVFPLAYFQRKILPQFNRFDKIIAVSQATAEAAIQRGIQKHKIVVIENGVDPHITNKPIPPLSSIAHKYPCLDGSKKYFITLGRPVKRKGFSWLIENVIPHLNTDFHLVMAGPFQKKVTWGEKLLNILPKKVYTLVSLFLGYPTDQKSIRKLIQQQRSKVIHLGKVSSSDLEILLAHAVAFLMPNIPIEGDMEGFGLVCLEASLANTLVIASSLEGITSAVKHQQNGLLLPPGDESAWIQQLQDVLDNTVAFRKKSLSFKAYTQANFSWDKMARRYVQLFYDLFADK